jgi:hypothetical protein
VEARENPPVTVRDHKKLRLVDPPTMTGAACQVAAMVTGEELTELTEHLFYPYLEESFGDTR